MEPIATNVLESTNVKSRRLRELVRAPEILVMPGAYDVLSALLFQQLGFQAIQGTSGGIAAALGYPDGEAMSRDLFVQLTGALPRRFCCRSTPMVKRVTAMPQA